MKKRKFILPLTAFALLLSFGLAACNGGGNNNGGESQSQQQSSGQQEKITITAAEGKNKLIKGETVQLTASVAGVTWESKNVEVATVDQNGLVTAIGKGTTSISATKEGYKGGSLSITVDLPSITITGAESNATLVMEATLQLSASEQGVTWESSDPSVASVDQTGKVTALYAGAAVISAKKDGFNPGTVNVTVTRPAALATLHWEDADHYSADGWWGTAAEGVTPIYARSSGNASDAQCIAHFDVGDKETLAFTSSAAIEGELVITMASSSAIDDMGAVMAAKFNNVAIDLTGKSFAGGSTSEFADFSLGNLNILKDDNVLELEFLSSSTPYLDDLAIYSKGQATIAVKAAPTRETIEVKLEEGKTGLTANIGEELQIELNKPTSLEGVTFASDKETVATVSEDGKITGVALGTANITIKKDGWYSARVEVTVEKKVLAGEIRVEAENTTNDLPSGFHKYTDRTSGIQNGHSGSAYITGYDVNSECELDYEFESEKDQTMSLIIAGASHYQMAEDFVFGVDCKLILNGEEVQCAADAKIESNQVMGAPTVEVTIGNVNVKAGTNTFVVQFTERAPALDCYRFMPLA